MTPEEYAAALAQQSEMVAEAVEDLDGSDETWAAFYAALAEFNRINIEFTKANGRFVSGAR